jgi:predicted glycosyltransferase
LVYSHDGFGLGNVRRCLRVCDLLGREIPGLSTLLVTSSPVVDAFQHTANMDIVKLPSVHRRARSQYVAKYLRSPYRDVKRMREKLVLAAFQGFNPHLVLVDKVPLGLGGELRPSLDWLKKSRPKARLILGMRDILDDPEQVSEQWRNHKLFEILERYYDSIWVFGTQRVCDVAQDYQFPPAIAGKLNYCGYVLPPSVLRPRDEIRRELGLTSEKLILVTAGGGGDGYELMKTFLKSARLLHGRRANGHEPAQSVVVLGPEMREVKRQRLMNKVAQTPGILRVLDFTAVMTQLMHAADLVVSMGGYNTLCEILSLEKRSIIVPRVHPVTEQWIRARRMQDLGLLEMLHPEDLTPEALAAKIDTALFAPGAERTASISHLLGAQGLPGLGRLAADQLRGGAIP